ncbi:MAG: nonstructural protein [Microviridae sp.]|nr:MAG: nonstructural protein [Microviridae sp.]
MKIYSVYDSKAEAYIQPIFSTNKATAIRSFAQAANDENTEFNRHAADYTLFEIGTWDEITGLITPDETKTPLGSALEHRQEKPTLREVG